MKIDFEPKVDAAYLQLENSIIVESGAIASGMIFDFNQYGSIVGVEILAEKKKGPRYLLNL